MPFLTILVILVVAAVIFLLIFLRFIGSLIQKVGPNEALIVYGRHTRVITNGGTVVWPMVEQATRFSLELMSFDVAPSQSLYTNQGIAVNVEAVTQLKVRSDRENILTAAEQFLSKTPEDREGLIRLVMEGHLRGIVGQLTVEQIVKEPEMVSEKMRSTSSSDLTKMGLEIVSFTIKEVRDNNDYIVNMGRPEIERIRKEANVAAALAARDTQIQQAAATQAAAIAKSQADQATVEAQTAADTKKAEYQRDLALKKASYDAEVKKQQATADKSYDIQENVMQQQVVAESTRIQEIEKTAQVKVEEAEIKRRELELQATVLKQAEAERQRITLQAEAERQRLALEAEGRAEALKAQGAAEAEAARLKGLADADVIRARGEAEAEAMRVKADAYHQYNQAAVLDKLLTSLPEVVRALAEPLAKIDRVTIVSTGDAANGHSSLGASRLTGDMVNMLAQVPALVETLSGVKLEDLLSRVPGLHPGQNGAEPAGTVASDNTSEDHK
ncbi:MAG TPA: SPFH domain-containing protein [Ktedonobacterales bacterium]|nr:SPFH domain-containing protein [Ktedonobacterales bacterium]